MENERFSEYYGFIFALKLGDNQYDMGHSVVFYFKLVQNSTVQCSTIQEVQNNKVEYNEVNYSLQYTEKYNVTIAQ